ncbi:GlsB/YeaQ/YmgE family stress response membrane protein [Corynebacterium amycolatum]|uniref:GlsB/YeaQ/YmgE family stress response membrane protein n=1 Tax=Corynebacterium amycolatum TaxID=43765 RepID=UPI00191F3E08|nr:GlsB/YeaQ/YmgE family stress response membrane protein [Corynebacterium amycolatum]MCQ9140868.1 GlsB/YeaQ/YmgE family stress response membrane protein [Corynebacterium amycolatum]QQV00751.1 GlsB/YeaQ/YmgE family stress response membrane protein [Corynebacterium amycolatum]
MNEILLAASSSPSLGFIGWIIIGGLAGWIGSKIMGTDASMGVVLNIIVGVIGGFLGGWLLTLFGVDVAGGGLIFSFLTCLLGAVILLWIVGLVQKRK